MWKCKLNCFNLVLIILSTFSTTLSHGWVVDDRGCRTPDGGVGDCIAIKKCESMLNFLQTVKRPYSTYLVNKLQAYTCSYGTDVRVCCPSEPINIVEPGIERSELSAGPPDVSKNKNLKLLPKDCGFLDIGNKIKNGMNALMNEFPWMALLSYKTKKGVEFRCGGTIITNKYILTAAHCISNLPFSLNGVRVGEHNILTSVDCEEQLDGSTKCNGPVQDLTIEQVIAHPRFNSSDRTNDIGLLRVSRIDLSVENASPICLPVEAVKDTKFNNAVATGWGYTDAGQRANASPILQKVDLPAVTLENCKKVYESQENVVITENHLCFGGSDGKDTCPGDSGGPLQAPAFLYGDIRYVQYGVVSFGPASCGLVGFPGVYTRVTYYMDWILNNLKS